jgi:hypothetical protein
MNASRGAVLALLGVVLFGATMAVGAVTAPERTVGSAGDAVSADPGTPAGPDGTTAPAVRRTLVGVQGGWVRHGSVLGLSGSDVEWRETSADGYFEVSGLPDGTVLGAYANETSQQCGDREPPCARTGFRTIDPDGENGPETVDEYGFPVRSLTNSEVHAVDRIADDEYVFVDMDQERAVVVEDGEEVWEWRAEQRYEAPTDPTTRDWLHINDVDVIDEDRFLVSVRNANQLLVLERGEGVVEVINRDDGGSDENCLADDRLVPGEDGDVRCGDPSVIREQHNPQWLGPGAVLVADSENDRVVELHRTEDGDWEPVWVLREAGGIELDWPRDADRLPNGNTLITDSLNTRVVEVDADGDVVWSISTDERVTSGPGIPYEADRLPGGEIEGRYDNASATGGESLATVSANASALDDTGSTVPGLSLAVAGLTGTFGFVPYWFGEFHLAVTIVALLAILAGAVDHLRTGRRVELPSP